MTVPVRVRAALAAAALLAVALLAAVATEFGLLDWGDPFADLPDDPSVTLGLAGAIPAAGDEPLAAPMGIAIGGRRVFVAESEAGRVAVFSVTGTRLSSIVLPVADGAMRSVPTAVAALGPRRVAVVDAAAGAVVVARAVGEEGTVLFRVGEDDPATAPIRPTAVAYDDGTLYVADADSGTIKRYDRAGRFVSEVPTDPARPLGFIGGMAVVDDRLVLAESDSDRVWRLDPGTGERAEVCPGTQALPRGIGAMPGGSVAITEVLGGVVYVCGGDGTLVRTIDSATVPEAQLRSPEGVAWRARTNRLYITDPDQGKVVIINVRM